MDFGKRGVYVVTEAVVHREPPSQFPVVLSKKAWLPKPEIRGKKAGASGHTRKGANKEGGQVLGGVLTIFLKSELIPAISVVALDFAGLSSDQRSSRLDGVLAKVVGDGSVVLKGVIQVLERDKPAVSEALNVGKLNERKAGSRRTEVDVAGETKQSGWILARVG